LGKGTEDSTSEKGKGGKDKKETAERGGGGEKEKEDTSHFIGSAFGEKGEAVSPLLQREEKGGGVG